MSLQIHESIQHPQVYFLEVTVIIRRQGWDVQPAKLFNDSFDEVLHVILAFPKPLADPATMATPSDSDVTIHKAD